MKRAEAIVRRGERRRGFVPYWLRFMAEVDVDFLEAYERIYELTAVRKGKLPPKFREMIVCAAVAIGGYQAGLKSTSGARSPGRHQGGAHRGVPERLFPHRRAHPGARHDRAHRRAEGAGVRYSGFTPAAEASSR